MPLPADGAVRDFDGNAVRRLLVIGQVVGVHIADELIEDGIVDITRARPIARLGYRDYAVVEKVFQMTRPEPRHERASHQAVRRRRQSMADLELLDRPAPRGETGSAASRPNTSTSRG
jgi:hypothetical protein